MLKVKASGKSCVLASLMADKIESSVLELMFEEGEVEFSVVGPNEIHLSGNMLDNDDGDDLNMMAGDDDDDDEEGEGSGGEDEDEDEDGDEDEDEGGDDSEEEAPPQKGAKKPKAAEKMEEDSDGGEDDEDDEEDEEDEVSIAAESTFARACIYVPEHATVYSCCRAMLHHTHERVSGTGRTMVKKTRTRMRTKTTTTKRRRRRRRRKQSARNVGRQQGSKRQQAQGSSRRRQPRRRPRKARQWRRPGPAKCPPTSKPRSKRCWQGTPLVSRAQISPGSGRRCMVREGGPSRMLWPSVASRSRLR